jgi:hypothetical protein
MASGVALMMAAVRSSLSRSACSCWCSAAEAPSSASARSAISTLPVRTRSGAPRPCARSWAKAASACSGARARRCQAYTVAMVSTTISATAAKLWSRTLASSSRSARVENTTCRRCVAPKRASACTTSSPGSAGDAPTACSCRPPAVAAKLRQTLPSGPLTSRLCSPGSAPMGRSTAGIGDPAAPTNSVDSAAAVASATRCAWPCAASRAADSTCCPDSRYSSAVEVMATSSATSSSWC